MKDRLGFEVAPAIKVGGIDVQTDSPPPSVQTLGELGVVSARGVSGQIIHQARRPDLGLFETRATPTPGGDYLLMFPDGSHYGRRGTKVNDILAYRSSDKGRTWQGPVTAFDIDYNQHGFVPLIPKGTQRIYAFGTQPVWGLYSRENGLYENAPIGYRYSDDDGRTWSEMRIIRPENDPDFTGMSVMRMCETDSGAWLIGTHEGDWSYNPLITRQYILRSENRGKTWRLLPEKRHGGWCALEYGRAEEGRPINLGGGEVYCMMRTPTGQLWQSRSQDEGKTWSDPQPTPLAHPDAPPMLFHLSDGRTLAAFHHNRHSVNRDEYKGHGMSGNPESFLDRAEVWLSLSNDNGHTWSEPQFVFANALSPTYEKAFRNHQCSYMDMFAENGVVHLFVPHRWERVLHLTFLESDLDKFPTGHDI